MAKRSLKKAFNVQDEYKTPELLITMIFPYLDKWRAEFITEHKREPIFWLPFDTSDSNYYKLFTNKGYKVVRSHLNDDKDFFHYQPEQFDIIVSNPPFSQKLKIMERIIFDLKKPFVLLMNMMSINYQEIGNLFQFVNPKIQFIIPDKKVSFDGNTSSFCSGYVCYDFIDHTEFVHLSHNNSKNNFSK